MPNLHDEGFEPVESASHNSDQSSSQTPRRRRVGRRVTRGAGAAGEVKVTVQEHGPLFTEPKTPALPASQEHAALPSGKSNAPTANTTDAANTADSDDRSNRRRRRPMTSLLFQEPVIPERHLDDLEDDDDSHVHNARPARKSSRTNDDTAHANIERTNDRHAAHDDTDDAEEQPRRRRRRTRRKADDTETPTNNNAVANEHTADNNELNEPKRKRARRQMPSDYDADFDDAQSAEETPRRKSNRRLNAQERRAAAEVEQIEEDLVLDDITYAPIDDAIAHNNRRVKPRANDEVDIDIEEIRENNDRHHADSDDEEEGQMRTRRRRRSRRADRDTQEETVETQETVDVVEDDEDEEETTVTRRRRRRRSKSAEEEAPVQRSRKQQYIDEITDVEGSTRLEAKKQRRRDNRRERSRQNQLLEQDFLARRENVDRLMVVRQRDRHTQISVLEDNVLVEHYVSDIQEVATVGNIYLGRVQNVLPSMEAAFVDIGQARNGVLYAGEVNWDTTRLEGQPRRIELAFKSGDPVLVQVTKDPIGHKGARLTSQVTLAGRFLVLVPSGGMTGVSRKLSTRERSRLKSIVSKIAPKDMGVIIRTAAEGASEEAITKDLEGLIHQWEHIQKKFEEFRYGKRPKLLQGEPDMVIRVVRDIFNDDFRKMIVEGDDVYQRIEEYIDTMAPDLRDKLEKWDPAEHQGKDVFDKWSIDSQLRKAMERQVYLPSGGSIVIDRTEAMTTIDVNTGRFIGKGKSLEETVTRCNLEASEEIARQLRLRDIGGMIMIDYVDMVMPSNRDLVLRRLVECLARDRTKHQVAEVTSLGLVQMTRKRIGQGLVEAFSEECPTCNGRGFIVHDTPTVSAEYDDPYALKGGDPFVKTNKHGHGSAHGAGAGSGDFGASSGSSGSSGSGSGNRKNGNNGLPKGSSAALKAKLAQIAAAAVAANNAEGAAQEAQKKADTIEVQIEHIEELVKSEQLLAAKAALDAQNEESVAQSMADIVAAAVKDAEAEADVDVSESAESSDASMSQTVNVQETEIADTDGDTEETVTVESDEGSDGEASKASEASESVEVSENIEHSEGSETAKVSETVTDTDADEDNSGEETVVEAEVTDADSSDTPESSADDVTVEVIPDSSES